MGTLWMKFSFIVILLVCAVSGQFCEISEDGLLPENGACRGPLHRAEVVYEAIEQFNDGCPASAIPFHPDGSRALAIRCGECFPGSSAADSSQSACGVNMYCTDEGICQHVSRHPLYGKVCPYELGVSTASGYCGPGLRCIRHRCLPCENGVVDPTDGKVCVNDHWTYSRWELISHDPVAVFLILSFALLIATSTFIFYVGVKVLKARPKHQSERSIVKAATEVKDEEFEGRKKMDLPTSCDETTESSDEDYIQPARTKYLVQQATHSDITAAYSTPQKSFGFRPSGLAKTPATPPTAHAATASGHSGRDHFSASKGSGHSLRLRSAVNGDGRADRSSGRDEELDLWREDGVLSPQRQQNLFDSSHVTSPYRQQRHPQNIVHQQTSNAPSPFRHVTPSDEDIDFPISVRAPSSRLGTPASAQRKQTEAPVDQGGKVYTSPREADRLLGVLSKDK